MITPYVDVVYNCLSVFLVIFYCVQFHPLLIDNYSAWCLGCILAVLSTPLS